MPKFWFFPKKRRNVRKESYTEAELVERIEKCEKLIARREKLLADAVPSEHFECNWMLKKAIDKRDHYERRLNQLRAKGLKAVAA